MRGWGHAKIYTFPLNIQVICVLVVPFGHITIEMRIFATRRSEKKEEEFLVRKSINKTFRKIGNKLYHVWNFSFLELFLLLFFFFSLRWPRIFGEPLKPPHSIEYKKYFKNIKVQSLGNKMLLAHGLKSAVNKMNNHERGQYKRLAVAT